MITEKFIWNYVGKPIVVFCYNKAKGKMGYKIKSYREKTNRYKFIKELDLNLLKSYQDEALYLSLSKLLAKKDVLEKIYNRSYKINIWDFKPDDEFTDELLNNCDFIKASERKSLRDILTHTLKVCCICLNEPINETERKINTGVGRILNFISKENKELIKCQNQGTMVISKLSDDFKKFTENNISEKECILKLNDKYDVTLTSKSEDVYFKIQLTAKMSDNLHDYSTFDDFFKHVFFTCRDEKVEICSYKVTNESGEILEEYRDENYYGPTLRIPDIFDNTYSITDDDKSKTVLSIVPPKIIFRINLEDEYGNILMENLELQVSRELLTNGNIRITLNDIRKNAMVNITIFIESASIDDNSNYNIISSSTNLKISDYTNPKHQLHYFSLIGKVLDKNILIIDSNTHEQIGMLGGIAWDADLTVEKICIIKEFYQHIIYLENELKIKISIPEVITMDNIENVKELFNLAKTGFYQKNDKGSTLNLYGVTLSVSNEVFIGNRLGFKFNFGACKLFEQEIKFSDDVIFFQPEGICKLIDKEKITLECLENSCCFIKSKYKDFNKLAEKYSQLNDVDEIV